MSTLVSEVKTARSRLPAAAPLPDFPVLCPASFSPSMAKYAPETFLPDVLRIFYITPAYLPPVLRGITKSRPRT